MPSFHPCPDENGNPVEVLEPSRSTPRRFWLKAACEATISRTEKPDLPEALNGIPFSHVRMEAPLWRFTAPPDGWREPALPETSKRWTSGLVVREADGRVWLVHPTNAFGGVRATFPKGRLEPGLPLVVNAQKETWEESGLFALPEAWLCDVERTKTVTRYYLARRAAGTPADAGWESQAVSLVPLELLARRLNRVNDRRVLPALFAALGRTDLDAHVDDFEPLVDNRSPLGASGLS